jgi:hypothetical protein
VLLTPASDTDALQFGFFSARVGYATEKQADAARDMLDCVDEWAIDFYFDRWRRR